LLRQVLPYLLSCVDGSSIGEQWLTVNTCCQCPCKKVGYVLFLYKLFAYSVNLLLGERLKGEGKPTLH